MKHIFKGTAIAITLIVLSPLVAIAASVEDELRGMANATQKGLPMRVNDEIQVTSMTASGKAILARYHFMMKSSELRSVEKLKDEYFRNSINGLCTHPDIAKLINRGAYWKYEYYDIDNRFVLGFVINQDSCKHFQ
ncbi:hypothetical protein [Methylobacter svalbardensis]|uniref:hypothetical protein n=1 Tax=Methylobacter svalbardensis TaxID=3080016 RepID=UPI0030ECF4E1